jgi:hypothetical protein
VIPSVNHLAWNPSRDPLVINVVVNVPGLIAAMTALGSPDHPHALHVHCDVKFQDLRDR